MEVANIEVAREKKERQISKTDILHQNLPTYRVSILSRRWLESSRAAGNK